MSAFHEAIKQILAEVNKFVNSLKDESLSKSSQKERTKLLASLQKIYNDYESLNPQLEENSSSSSKDESRFTSGSTHSHGSQVSEEDSASISDSIPYATVKSLTGATKLGYLLKKPTDLLEKISKNKQKKYCVVHKSVMYWFQKYTDKKHQGAIFLTGYEFKDVSPSEKDFVFELSAPRKKSYQFQADNKDDFESWQKAIETGIKFVEQIQELSADEEGENYEPIDEVVNAVKSQRSASVTTLGSSGPSAARLPITECALPPLPSQESSEPQEVYVVDAISTLDTSDADTSPSKTEIHKPSIVSRSDNLEQKKEDEQEFDKIEDDDMIYEFIESPPVNNNTSTKTDNVLKSSGATIDEIRSSIPTSPPPRPPLPSPPQSSQGPPPLPERGINIPSPPSDSSTASRTSSNKDINQTKMFCPKLDLYALTSMQEDYENMFYGNWPCVGSCDDELSFDRGDVIHVLNRDLDSDNWWIGEKSGHIGLVPKTYLIPVYQLIA